MVPEASTVYSTARGRTYFLHQNITHRRDRAEWRSIVLVYCRSNQHVCGAHHVLSISDELCGARKLELTSVLMV